MGGANKALPGRLPPIQFWLRRTSPGCLVAPRTPCIRRRWVSFSNRMERGKPMPPRLGNGGRGEGVIEVMPGE